MKTRCTRISGSIIALQRQIEIFQSQSATLVFSDFPQVEKSLQEFSLIWTHCWGTLKTLERENYSAFCDTTYILFTDFLNAFPTYRDCFPVEYSPNSFEPQKSEHRVAKSNKIVFICDVGMRRFLRRTCSKHRTSSFLTEIGFGIWRQFDNL